MKVRYIISILMLHVSVSLPAQDNIMLKLPVSKLTGTVYYTPPEGNSEYFFLKDWVPGSIRLTNGDLYEGVQANYYVMGDELVIFHTRLKQLVRLDKEKVKEFSLETPEGNRDFIRIAAGSQPHFYEIVYEGNYSLLVFHYIFEQKNRPYHDKNGFLRHTRLIKKKRYFLYSAGEPRLAPLQENPRSLIQNFPGQQKELKKTLRTARLKGKKEEKFVKAFQVLDEAALITR